MPRKTFTRRADQIERLMDSTGKLAVILPFLRQRIIETKKTPEDDPVFEYLENEIAERNDIILSDCSFAERCRGVATIRRRFRNLTVEDGQVVRYACLFDDD